MVMLMLAAKGYSELQLEPAKLKTIETCDKELMEILI
jgi:hypothetical protein